MEIVQAVALPVILIGLQHHPASFHVQKNGMGALYNLAKHDGNRVLMVEDGVLPVIFASLEFHFPDSEAQQLQEWGIGTLRYLSQNTTNRAPMVEAGALPIIIKSLRSHIQVKPVQLACLGAILELVRIPMKQERTLTTDALKDAIVQSLHHHQASEEIQLLGKKILKSMAADESIV